MAIWSVAQAISAMIPRLNFKKSLMNYEEQYTIWEKLREKLLYFSELFVTNKLRVKVEFYRLLAANQLIHMLPQQISNENNYS